MPPSRKNIPVQSTPFIQKYGIVVGLVIGIIFGLIGGIVLPQLTELPFGNTCSNDISFSIDEDFTISVTNGTDGTPIHVNSDEFECLLVMLSIIEFDPIIIQAYKDNATGIPLNETITNNQASYMSYKNVMIANSKFQLFLTEIFEGINGTLPEPTEEELLELLTPLERGVSTTTKSYKPCLLAGMSMILANATYLSDPENINITDITEIFNNTYIPNTGFVEDANLLNLAIPSVLESPFFLDSCADLSFNINHLDMNSTIVDGTPDCDLISWEGELNGEAITGDFAQIPLNVIGLMMTLVTLFDEIIL